MKNLPLIFLGLLGFGLPVMQAQQPPLPVPDGPFLNHPDMARWRLTIVKKATAHPGDDSAASPRQNVVITLTKTGDVAYEETADGSAKSSKWYVGSTTVQISNATPDPVPLTGAPPHSDFPECDWVAASNYVKTDSSSEPEALVFEAIVNSVSDAELSTARTEAATSGATFNEDAYKVKVTARIDAKTRLPIVVTKGAVTYTYQFLTPPQEALVVPPSIQKIVDSEQTRMKDFERKPAKS